jgi:hypothetical protein
MMMSTMDASAPLRQGMMMIGGHPIASTKAAGSMLRAMVDPKYASQVDDVIRSNPNYQMARESGLFFGEMNGGLNNAEEVFMAQSVLDWRLDWIPGINKNVLAPVQKPLKIVTNASERAYVTYLNKVRMDVFDGYAKVATKNMKRDKNGQVILDFKTEQVLRRCASFINAATGRSDIPLPQLLSQTATAALFSPRFQMSRFQLVGQFYNAFFGDYLTKTGGKVVGKEWVLLPLHIRGKILKDMVAGVGGAVGMIGLAYTGLRAYNQSTGKGLEPTLPGIDVQFGPGGIKDMTATFNIADPRFGKLRVQKPTTPEIDPVTGEVGQAGMGSDIDITGGYAPLIRTVISLMGIEDPNKVSKEKRDIIERFIYAKLNPSFSLLRETNMPIVGTGETFIGEDPGSLTQSILRNTTPMLITEVLEAVAEYDAVTAASLSFGAAFGAGITTYQKHSDVRDAISQEMHQKDFEELTAEQKEEVKLDQRYQEYDKQWDSNRAQQAIDQKDQETWNHYQKGRDNLAGDLAFNVKNHYMNTDGTIRYGKELRIAVQDYKRDKLSLGRAYLDDDMTERMFGHSRDLHLVDYLREVYDSVDAPFNERTGKSNLDKMYIEKNAILDIAVENGIDPSEITQYIDESKIPLTGKHSQAKDQMDYPIREYIAPVLKQYDKDQRVLRRYHELSNDTKMTSEMRKFFIMEEVKDIEVYLALDRWGYVMPGEMKGPKELRRQQALMDEFFEDLDKERYSEAIQEKLNNPEGEFQKKLGEYDDRGMLRTE